MARTKKGSPHSRFQVGDKVRVKPGVSDPDYPDMPLGGWSGTITEIRFEGNATIPSEQIKQKLLSRVGQPLAFHVHRTSDSFAGVSVTGSGPSPW